MEKSVFIVCYVFGKEMGKAHVISGEGTYMQIYAMMLGKNV